MLALELVVVMYLTSTHLIPGGHRQFQIWYQQLVPLLLSMLPLPIWMTFAVYQNIYPNNVFNPNVHHTVILAIVAWLHTFGVRGRW